MLFCIYRRARPLLVSRHSQRFSEDIHVCFNIHMYTNLYAKRSCSYLCKYLYLYIWTHHVYVHKYHADLLIFDKYIAHFNRFAQFESEPYVFTFIFIYDQLNVCICKYICTYHRVWCANKKHKKLVFNRNLRNNHTLLWTSQQISPWLKVITTNHFIMEPS